MISRSFLIDLMSPHFDFGLNVINVEVLAEQRGIHVRHVTSSTREDGIENVTIEVTSPKGNHAIEGTVHADGTPHILSINGYRMDMVPDGHMVILFNDDEPGVIGLVGTLFGKHKVNIADLTLARRADTALQVFKIDEPAPAEVIEELRDQSPPIRLVRTVTLPPLQKHT